MAKSCDSSKGSCFPGSTPSQYTSTPEELRRLPENSPSSEGNSRCTVLVRPGMLRKQPTHSQHQACEFPPPQHSDPVGYFGVGLGAVCNSLHLSPFQLDQQVSEEEKPRRSNTVDCLPSVTSTGLVPPPSGVANRQSSIASNSQRPTVRPNADQQMFSTSPVGLSGVAGIANNRLITFD